MGNARRSSSAAPSQQERCFMNSITTRVWIAGASGRLGSALSHRFGGNTAYKLVTSDRDVAVEDVSVVGRFADINHPDVIINCAGLTDVQACEENPEEAYKINAIGARNLATAARRIDAKFIQISTDDVFGGDEGKHVIVRSSWLYGVGSYDFVDRVLDTAAKEGAVHLPEDEISSPTSAEALAGFIDCLMHSREYGLFHASCDGSCSRAEYAREILRLAGKENVPVTSASENTALRPRFTLLDNMMLRITGLYQMPDWHDALSEYMSHRQTRVNK